MKRLGIFISKILGIGVNEKHEADERLIIKTVNSISLCLAILCPIAAIPNFMMGVYFNAFLFVITSILFFLNFVWVYSGKVLIAKLVITYIILLIPVVNLLVNGSIPDHQYLGIVIITSVTAYLSSIIYDLKSENKIYWISIIFIIIYSVFYDTIFRIFSSYPPQINYLLDNYPPYKFGHILLILIVVSISYYLKKLLLHYQKTINHQHYLLETLNDSLEEQVEQKTKSITDSKNKIAELAFLTSHKVRGPLSTILGFTQLINENTSNQEAVKMFPKLHERAKVMDQVIREMNDKIQEELDE